MMLEKLPVFAAAALLALVAASPGFGQGYSCQYEGQSYSTGASRCVGGYVNVCLSNGGWRLDRLSPCYDQPVSTRQCRAGLLQTASPGARSCVNGRLQQCAEDGTWMDLGRNC